MDDDKTPPGGFLPWDAPEMQVASDSKDASGRRARYRLLQSWYREHVLDLKKYGTAAGGGRWVGSMLHEDDVTRTPGLNLMPEAAEYALQRVRDVNRAGGSAEEYRLRHNMLSSMPMCFSIFGTLRGMPDKGLEIVRALLAPKAAEVEWIECEWRPDTNPLGDRTAFDAALLVRDEDGSRHVVGVETKYTEPFSQREYVKPRYVHVHDESGWFRPEMFTTVAPRPSNQLWRNVLLAAACEGLPEFDRASVVVLALDGDLGADAASGALSKALKPEYQDRCRSVSLESLVDKARAGMGPGAEWANRFEQRYLDLTPLTTS